MEPHRLTVRLRQPGGRFGSPVFSRGLQFGRGLAIGDIDGRHGKDILAVEGCVSARNVHDVLLLNAGGGRRWKATPVPSPLQGCGDVAATLDFDRDGKADFVVLNGGRFDGLPYDRGPDQLLTMGRWPS